MHLSVKERMKRIRDISITDEEGAKEIALRIFRKYTNNQERAVTVPQENVGVMINNAYKGINKNFTSQNQDVELYMKLLDVNGDGQVSLEDLEKLCIRQLVGRHE